MNNNAVTPHTSKAQGLSGYRPPQIRDRLTCTVREACCETGIGKTKMHALISGGALESVKIGRRRLVKVPSLLRLIGQGDSEG
jgi:excisionase family DNA binding protein